MEFTRVAEIYDCIVVGIGGHGSSIAANLAKSGVKVLGLEQFGPVHSKGSSHGRTRIYRQAYFEDPKYVPLLRRSLELWRDLDAFYQSSVRDTLTVVDGTMKSIKAHNMPHEVLSAAAMRERYPLFRLSEDDIGVYEANAGVLMAEPCIETFIAQARLHGADLRFEEPMLEWSAVGAGDADAPAGLTRGVRVRTSKGTYFGRKLVLSVGAWAVGLYGKAIPQAQLYIERRVLFWFKASAEAVEGFKKFPVYIWDLGGVRGNFYGFPTEDNSPGEVKVAFHVTNSTPADGVASPEAVDREVHPAEVEAMRAVLSSKIPEMNNELIKTTTCMYTSTVDGHFVIDFHPENRDVVLASPCSGHGFKLISVVGEIVGDLVRDGKTRHDISLFSAHHGRTDEADAIVAPMSRL